VFVTDSCLELEIWLLEGRALNSTLGRRQHQISCCCNESSMLKSSESQAEMSIDDGIFVLFLALKIAKSGNSFVKLELSLINIQGWEFESEVQIFSK